MLHVWFAGLEINCVVRGPERSGVNRGQVSFSWEGVGCVFLSAYLGFH